LQLQNGTFSLGSLWEHFFEYRSRKRIMSLFGQIDSPVLFVFIVVLLGLSFFLMLRSNRYFNRQRQAEQARPHAPRLRSSGAVPSDYNAGDASGASPSDRSSALAQHLHASPPSAQWEVEMHETARQLKAQLDSKMSALQALIAEADRAASRLEAATKKKEENGDHQQPSIRLSSGGSPLFAPKSGPQSDERKRSAAAAANRAPVAQPAQPAATMAGISSRNHQKEICSLADGGLSGATIAQRLAIPVGEVELILSLRGKK
jgi:hypothetical protein